MRKLIISLLAIAVLCVAMPAQALEGQIPLPNLKAITAYDFVIDDLAFGADSDLLRWPFAKPEQKQDDVTLVALNVGYLASDDTSIWIMGASLNIANLAKKVHLDYGWGALQTEIGGYGGRNFDTREWNYGIKASLVKLEFGGGQ